MAPKFNSNASLIKPYFRIQERNPLSGDMSKRLRYSVTRRHLLNLCNDLSCQPLTANTCACMHEEATCFFSLTVPLPSTLFGCILVRFRLNPAISIFLKRTVNLTCGMLNWTVHDLKTIKIFFTLKSIYMHFIRGHNLLLRWLRLLKLCFDL